MVIVLGEINAGWLGDSIEIGVNQLLGVHSGGILGYYRVSVKDILYDTTIDLRYRSNLAYKRLRSEVLYATLGK